VSDLVKPFAFDLLKAFNTTRAIFRRHGKAFDLPSKFLRREKRLAATAVFAFCRMILEAIDVGEGESTASSCGPSSLDARVDMFRERLDEIYSFSLDLPLQAQRTQAQHVMGAIARVVERYEIPRQYFLDFADGRRMELSVKRFPTWARLEKILSLTAGSAGRMMCAILGVQHSDAADFANMYCGAMALTTILLNVKRDFDAGRIYLPLEDLARFGYSERDLAANVVNDQFRELMKFQIARARSLYRDGADGLIWLPEDGSRMAAAALGTTWSSSLAAIEAAGYDVLTKPVQVSLTRRAMRIPAAWKLAKRFGNEPMPDVF
jgi:phytoene synthase